MLTIDLKNELELSKKNSGGLSEALNEVIETLKKKEAVILDISGEKEQLKTNAADLKVYITFAKFVASVAYISSFHVRYLSFFFL